MKVLIFSKFQNSTLAFTYQFYFQADVFAKLRHAIWTALEEYKTRVEQSQEDAVEIERRRIAQNKAARERVRQKRIRSSLKSEKLYRDDI